MDARHFAGCGLLGERIILPDNIKAWTQSRSPLLSYESLTPLSHFPIIAVFSLAYELEVCRLIQALEASRFSTRVLTGAPRITYSLGRSSHFSNPIPVAPFVDAILLGEAEETIIPAITASFESDRSEWLKTIATLPGGYVPELHGAQVPDIAKASDALLPARSHIISPDAELRNMFLIEGERGCHRSVHFV